MSFLAKGVKKAIGKPSKTTSADVNFLHGTLEIEVRAAKKLPNMEGFHSKLVDKKDVTDPFVDVQLDKVRIIKTSVINNDLNPEWDEHYSVVICHQTANLRFLVKDKDHAYSEVIGEVDISSEELLDERKREGWYDIKTKSGSSKGKGSLHIMAKFTKASSMPKSYEVPAYFPMHNNCHVTLYQDAEVPPGLASFRGLQDPHGGQHVPGRCWHDVYDTITSAKHVIFITGWAVWDKLQLFRGRDLQKDSRTLGELLIEQANKGVQVYVLVWSEFTSGSIVGDKGIMGTHDMETYNRFKDTAVHCALAPREISKNEFTDRLQNTFSSGAYTHHQKSIICDVDNPIGSGKRRLVAFVGGLDLTGGRWDTPSHPLFSTILNEHNGDFLNNNAPTVSPTQGPREPWHDIHSRVEGPVANDVFQNFADRWEKQAEKDEGKIDMKVFANIDMTAPAPLPNNDPNQAWNVQFFRSITSDSAKFNPKFTKMLNSKKGRTVDSSIAQAYVQMIRNAENFIYIENQYFMGSAFNWFQDNDTNCNHVIPIEIAQKIVEKISKKERFTAYILIPMFPEGDPASAPIQEILYWQTRTIEMMYKKVGDALLQYGLNSHPTDWLLFLCPGKRESPGDYLNQLESPEEGMAKKLRDTLRFPIYVHSKMMIVDDAYIILGSANINQRSMAGTRDTEMAVGCWQPAFPEQNPYGDVHMFRMSLWAEHMCITDPAFKYPGTKECVQRFKEMIHYNWACYTSPEPKPTPGHCLPYPLNIMPDGTIETLEGVKNFPDFPSGSRVMGKKSNVIPEKVTT